MDTDELLELDKPPGFFSRHAPTLVALSSLVVAACALVVSLWSLFLEMRYKEATIEPHITVSTRSRDYSLRWRNDGLGPARLSRIRVATDKGCIDSKRLSDAEWNAQLDEFLRSYTNEIFEAFQTDIVKQRLRITSGIPTAGTLIQAGDSREIILLQQEGIAGLDDDLTKRGVLSSYKANFLQKVEALKVVVDYESVTGNFNARWGTRPDGCPI